MRVIRSFRWALAVSAILLIGGFETNAHALTSIIEGADVQADAKTVKAIVAAFDQAENALQAEDLLKLMDFYSKDYNNRGLHKQDTGQIWQDLFGRYDHMSSRHLFSKIVVDENGKTAHVTCTGALFGVSKFQKKPGPVPMAETQPVIVDSWFEAIHHLVKENGAWKLIGHDPAKGQESFGAAIHLLF
jgi:hypothetical protein